MRRSHWMFFAVLVCSVARASTPLLFTAQIVDSGLMNGHEAFVVVAELRNPTDSDVEVTMMTCSWSDSFLIEPSARFSVPGQACDSNFPAPYVLRPRGGYIFVFPVIALRKDEKIEGEELHLGFSMTTSLLVKAGMQPELRWALPMKIPNVKGKLIANTYERAPLPKNASVPTP